MCELDNINTYFKAGTPAECKNKDNKFYVQAACTYTPEEVSKHKLEGLIVASLAVFMALFYICYIDYIRSKAKNDYVEWDAKLITASDYTVELEIPQTMYSKFVSDIYDPDYGKSKATAFRDYLKKELETRLSRFPNLGFEEGVEEVRIA